ncbi:MAG TPA: hypothetical protein VGM05_26985 [Planctomycetaceae bacterium]|jgi:hypothetical protein
MNVRTSINIIVAALVGISLAASPAVVRAEFKTEKGWSGHLFSSYIIATAAIKLPAKSADGDEDSTTVLGDRQGLLGVTIEADEDEQPIKVTITCDSIMEPSVFSCTLPEAGETYTINPKIKYKYDQLAKRSQTGPVTVTYKVEIGDAEAEEETETLTLRSVNDCPFVVVKDGAKRDVSFMFAAYVNEQHPFVDNVLREALDTEIVDSFTGYQTKNKKDVYRQAYALWHALSKRDVRYSSITTSVAQSETVGSQHVRLIEESINNGQANCVDGSVLMASLLRKIGVEPLLVIVPGHCYLAFSLDAEGKEVAALETTLIGSVVENDTLKVNGLEDVVDEDSQEENSWKTFKAAIATGVTNLNKNAKNFQDAKKSDYQLISVVAARKLGILPIAFQANQRFVAAPADDPANESDDDDDSKK